MLLTGKNGREYCCVGRCDFYIISGLGVSCSEIALIFKRRVGWRAETCFRNRPDCQVVCHRDPWKCGGGS